MDEIIMNLTGMASLSIGNNIRNHLWPVVAKCSESTSKFGSGLVSSAYTVVSFPDGFLCLFVLKATEQDSII